MSRKLAGIIALVVGTVVGAYVYLKSKAAPPPPTPTPTPPTPPPTPTPTPPPPTPPPSEEKVRVYVQVRDLMSYPISNALVELDGNTKYTDGGDVMLEVYRGTYSLKVSKEGYKTYTSTVEVKEDTSIRVVMEALGAILTGKVVDKNTGVPVKGAFVQAVYNSISYSGYSSADGSFSITVPVKYTQVVFFSVSADGYKSYTVTQMTVNPGVNSLGTIALEPYYVPPPPPPSQVSVSSDRILCYGYIAKLSNGAYFITYTIPGYGCDLIVLDRTQLSKIASDIASQADSTYNFYMEKINYIQQGYCVAKCQNTDFMVQDTCDKAMLACELYQGGFIKYWTVDEIYSISNTWYVDKPSSSLAGLSAPDQPTLVNSIKSKLITSKVSAKWTEWTGNAKADANSIKTF
ncbi:MAG: carboxypeptidase regulatory-like domain-containing protein [Candidatus Bathyarchaeia archaeon]